MEGLQRPNSKSLSHSKHLHNETYSWNTNLPHLSKAKIYKKIAVFNFLTTTSQIEKFMRPTWRPSESCRPQMGPMLAPWSLLSGYSPFWTRGTRLTRIMWYAHFHTSSFNSCKTILSKPQLYKTKWKPIYPAAFVRKTSSLLAFTCIKKLIPPQINMKPDEKLNCGDISRNVLKNLSSHWN